MQKQVDKRTSAAVESLLSLRAGTPVSEDTTSNCTQWRPPSPANSVISSSSDNNNSLSPIHAVREEMVSSLPPVKDSTIVSLGKKCM